LKNHPLRWFFYWFLLFYFWFLVSGSGFDATPILVINPQTLATRPRWSLVGLQPASLD
jgi:hypothetical protein